MQLFPRHAESGLHSPWLHWTWFPELLCRSTPVVLVLFKELSWSESRGGSIDAGGYRCNQLLTPLGLLLYLETWRWRDYV